MITDSKAGESQCSQLLTEISHHYLRNSKLCGKSPPFTDTPTPIRCPTPTCAALSVGTYIVDTADPWRDAFEVPVDHNLVSTSHQPNPIAGSGTIVIQSLKKTSPIPTKGPVEGTHRPPPNTQATYRLPEAGAASLGTPTHTQPRKAQCTAPPEALTHKGEKFSPARPGTNHHPTALLF